MLLLTQITDVEANVSPPSEGRSGTSTSLAALNAAAVPFSARLDLPSG